MGLVLNPVSKREMSSFFCKGLLLTSDDFASSSRLFPLGGQTVKSEHHGFTTPVSRRSFFTSAFAAAGTATLINSSAPSKLWADEDSATCGSPGLCDFPVPIPHFAGLHFFFPGPVEGVDANTGHEPSLIFNFKGSIGGADFAPIVGTGINLNTGATAPYTFHADIRFMKGIFVGTDGTERRGSFVFI
jgi:hypothetical protein